MKKSNYFKSIFRDIKDTKGKVFSIFVMIMLASMVVVALFLTGASMRNTLDKTLKSAKHPDITIKASYGLKDEDKLIINKDEDIDKVSYQKSLDLYDGKNLLNLNSIDETFPKYNISKGRDVKENDEIVLDEKLEKSYKIGDKIKFGKDDNENLDEELKNKEYKLVGFANSSENIMNDLRDYSVKGKRMVDGFAFISLDNFKDDKIDKANISYKETKNMDKFDEEYIDFVHKKENKLKEDFENRPSKVIKKIKDDANKKLDEKEEDLDKAKDKLSDEEKKLYDANIKILNGLESYNESQKTFNQEIKNAESKLRTSKNQIDQGFIDLNEGKAQYQKGLNEFNTNFSRGEAKLNSSKEQIDRAYEKLNSKKLELEEKQSQVENSFSEELEKINSLNTEVSNLKEKLSQKDRQINDKREKISELESKLENFDKNHEKDNKLDNEKEDNEDDNEESYKEDPSLIENSINEYKIALENDLEERGKLQASYSKLIESYKNAKNQYEGAYDKAMSPINEGLNQISTKENELKSQEAKINEKIAEIGRKKENAQNRLNESQAKIAQSEQKLRNAQESYNSGLSEFNRKKSQGRQRLNQAYNELIENQRALDEANDKFMDEKKKAQTDIKKGYEKIDESRKDLVKLPDPSYDISNIFSNEAIDTYYKNSLNMDKLAKVFPTFFYFIALLVSLTTIKRYIEEQRLQNGTLKALGYSSKDIANKFYIYALTPTLFGSLIGAILGKYIVAKVIYNAYSSGFDLVSLEFADSLLLILITILLSLLLIGLTVFFTSRSVVKEQTADLLRPKPPKGGSRILLEKFDFIWSRLSFMTKITFRNLFRYKSRMFMTIFGIGGCTALLFFGFAMTDSIEDTISIQKNEIINYDYISIFDKNAEDSDKDEYEKIIKDQNTKRLYYKNVEVDGNISANLMVFENTKDLDDFINIRDEDKNPISLDNESVVVSKNLYESLDDKSKLSFENGEDIKIKDVAENYINDYIYMTKESYENNFSKDLSFNADLINAKDHIKEKLLKNDASLSIIEANNSFDTMDSLMSNLNLVIGIITLVSMVLAIVVLYNLTNINVSERKKELATTKVLGFYPKETTAYIYRETYILTLIGIVLGYILGYIMLRYVLSVVAPDGIFLSVKTHPSSYIISALITLFISFVIMIIVHIKLKKINMAEAMKAGE